MAKKIKTKKRTPKKKIVKPDGIYLEKSKGQFYLNVWNNGRELIRSSETYHNYKDILDSMESATKTLAEFFIMNNNSNFHDNTGGK